MAIAKGRPGYQAAQDFAIEGFNQLINNLIKSSNNAQESLKAQLYDIITDSKLSEEEKRTYQNPLDGYLSDIESQDIRMRSVVLLGIYSFWEVSLNELYNVISEHNVIKHKKVSVYDCIKLIWADKLTSNVSLIYSDIRELRNYICHRSLNEKRDSTIRKMSEEHREFAIIEDYDGFYISSYDGLREILNVIINGLKEADERVGEVIKAMESKTAAIPPDDKPNEQSKH